MKRNIWLLFLLVFLAIMGLGLVHYKSVGSINKLKFDVYHLAATSKLSINEVVRQNNFKKIDETQKINFGYTNAIHWFKISIPKSTLARTYSLEISNNAINQLELYQVKNSKIVSMGLTGDSFIFENRPTANKNFVYQIVAPAHNTTSYYLYINKQFENFSTYLNLWNTAEYDNIEQRSYFLWGLFLGLGIIVIVTNVFFFIATKDPVYLWFSVYLLGVLLRQLAQTGLGFQYLWPNIPKLNNPDAGIYAFWFYIPAVIHFQQNLLGLKTSSPRLYTTSQFFKYTTLVLFVGISVLHVAGIWESLSISFTAFAGMHALLATFLLLLFFGIGLSGIRSANLFIGSISMGFVLQTILQIIISTQNLSLYFGKSGFFIDANYITLIVFLIDILFFSYILAYRYQKTTDENNQLQYSLAHNNKNLNKEIIEILDYERQDIHQNLQNNIGEKLKAVLKLLAKTEDFPIKKEAEKLINSVQNSLEKIANNAQPIAAFKMGLLQKLKLTIEKLNESQTIKFAFHGVLNENKLNEAQEIQLFRIVNELINNILKHSAATQAQISITANTTQLEVIVADNGQGFDPSHAQTGIGLNSIQARAKELLANIQIQSSHTGTIVTLKMNL
jgi:two-component system, sensor histidine kinase LadS